MTYQLAISLPTFGTTKQCFNKHGSADVLQHADFISFGHLSRNEIAGSYSSIFNFLRNLHIFFTLMKTTNLHSHQEHIRIPFFLHSPSTCYIVFLVTAILTGMRWYLFVVLICTSMIISHVEHFFIWLIGHSCVFFWEKSICQVSIFKSVFLLFLGGGYWVEFLMYFGY